MKRIVIAFLTAALWVSMSLVAFASSDTVAYLSSAGRDSNDGLSDSTAKQTFGSVGGNGVVNMLKDGGTLVISGAVNVGASRTWETEGEVTFTSAYNGVDHKKTDSAGKPSDGYLSFTGGYTFTIASDVVFDDFILYQKSNQNTLIVTNGATLTITENLVCLTDKSYYMRIFVDEGGTVNVNGGIFQSVIGKGTINIGEKAKIIDPSSMEVPSRDEPAPASNNVCYLNSFASANNTGLTPDSPIQSYITAQRDLIPNGGTIVIVASSYIGITEYTFQAKANPIVLTSVYDGVVYKNPEGPVAPACCFRLARGAVIYFEGDAIFDDIILFQQFPEQNTFYVKSGATLTVTDTVDLMSSAGLDYHFKLVLEKGALAVLSEEAQKVFEIENNGGEIITYQEPEEEKTDVILTIGSTIAYINGVPKTLDAAPINRNNRTMLPVRFLANVFGVDNDGIQWNAETRTATLKNDDVTIIVTIDSPAMTVNGKEVALDSPAIIENNRTYLPVRAIANALGVSNENITWNASTNTAILVK